MKTFSALLALCAGNSPVSGEFPSQRPVTRSLDVFFDLGLKKRLSKQSRHRWFETPSRVSWRHCNEQWKNRQCQCQYQCWHDIYTSILRNHISTYRLKHHNIKAIHNNSLGPNIHYIDVTWGHGVSSHLFVQKLFRLKTNIKAPYYWPCKMNPPESTGIPSHRAE